MVLEGCEKVLNSPSRPGSSSDSARITAIESSPRFKSWLMLDDSTMSSLNENSDIATNMEMSFVSAKVYRRALEI
jgi:hypothetical protein